MEMEITLSLGATILLSVIALAMIVIAGALAVMAYEAKTFGFGAYIVNRIGGVTEKIDR